MAKPIRRADCDARRASCSSTASIASRIEKPTSTCRSSRTSTRRRYRTRPTGARSSPALTRATRSFANASCLFIQNLNFEASAERTLNNLVSYNIKNERMVRLMTGELDVLLSGMARLNNATEAAAMFSAQLNEVAATTRDVRDMLSAIHQTAMVVETQQKSLADTVTSLVALQQEATATLAGILASDVTLQDAVFYALAIISLVLATSIGVPAKLRGVYFVWLAIVLAVERAFPLTAGSKVVVRKFVALVIATAWFLVEWSHRVGRMATKRRRGSTTAKAAEWSPPATTTAQRRSPRATRK